MTLYEMVVESASRPFGEKGFRDSIRDKKSKINKSNSHLEPNNISSKNKSKLLVALHTPIKMQKFFFWATIMGPLGLIWPSLSLYNMFAVCSFSANC